MPTLQLTGVDLYYETRGSGPVLLLVPGDAGHGRVYEQAAKALEAEYTVVLYDRRGYSRSVVTGEQDLERRLAVDAADAAALLAQVSAGPALVFGSSCGAVVAQALLASWPAGVRAALCHEPLSFAALPADAAGVARARVEQVYGLYRRSGVQAALLVLGSTLGAGAEAAALRAALDPAAGDDARANALFWFEFELRQYPAAPLDLPALQQSRDRLVPLVGADSADTPWAFAAKALAAGVGTDVQAVAGGHMGFVTAPDEFGASLREVLRRLA